VNRAMTAIVAVIIGLTGSAWAHEKAASGGKAAKQTISIEEKAFGREGDPKKVTRTVNVDMSDAMRFNPAELTVIRGETIRFVAKNSGKFMHEMVLGTMQELKEHAGLMKKNPGMEHDEPYMVHVASGKTERIVWQFTKPGEFYYGCLIPGHFEAGMVGKVVVK
jgi:uncharacterized cupredoxin-like copper-binding protein